MPFSALQMTCDKCKVASTCPKKGASPFLAPKARKPVFCHILGNYGRDPVEPRMLGPESLARMQKDGPCLTLAEVPGWDEECERVQTEIVKIFSPPIRHPRESVPWNINLIHPKGGGGT